MTAQSPATAEMETQIFDSGPGSGSERKTQNPAGVDSGNPVSPLLWW